MMVQTTCHTQTVIEYEVFYREAGADAWTARLMLELSVVQATAPNYHASSAEMC